MTVPPNDDDHVSRQVVYTATTSSRQNVGVIIAIVVLALILVGFIVMQVRKSPPKRHGELTRPAGVLVAQTAATALSFDS